MSDHTATADRSEVRRLLRTVPANFVDGQWVPFDGADLIDVQDPATGEVLSAVPASTAGDVDAAVAAAESARAGWAGRTPADRATILHRLADLCAAHADELALIEAVDAGKPITAVRDEELPGVLDGMRFFAGAARALSAPAGGEYMAGLTSTMRREPVGIVAGITPWNYPLLQTVAKVVPALAAGNTFVLKPAETTPLSAQRLVELAARVLPPGVLNVVFGRGGVAGDALVRHPAIGMVSFTGSIETGRRVGAAAADGVKRSVLELGGNSPVVIFADADLARLDSVVTGGLYNAGQECMAASRLIVHESLLDEVVSGLVERCRAAVLGDTLDPVTTLGPLNSAAQLARVEVKLAARPGHCEVVLGGARPDRAGYYLEPTVVVGARQDDELVQEEIFGPVFTVQTFAAEEEGIAMANGTRYGLAASVFTRDVGRAVRVSNALDFGTVWINNHLVFGPDLPVSGFGASGTGTENGNLGVLEFTRVKHVMIDQR